MNGNNDFEKVKFFELFRYFQEKYPDSNVTMSGTLVYKNHECKFNIEGYNLLYNLTRLMPLYEEEIL